MLRGFITGLILAFILSLFGVQTIITKFYLTAFHFTLTLGMYYVIFGFIGLFFSAFKRK